MNCFKARMKKSVYFLLQFFNSFNGVEMFKNGINKSITQCYRAGLQSLSWGIDKRYGYERNILTLTTFLEAPSLGIGSHNKKTSGKFHGRIWRVTIWKSSCSAFLKIEHLMISHKRWNGNSLLDSHLIKSHAFYFHLKCR